MKHKPFSTALKWASSALLVLGLSVSTAQSMPLHQGMTVTTSPLLGLRSAFDASDLVVNLPTINEDLRLLEQRKALKTHARAKGQTRRLTLKRPVVELSGALEAQAVLGRDYMKKTSHNIDLNRFSLQALVHVSPWVTALATLDYDNADDAGSAIYLKRGFFTIGNLNRSPVYLSVGQMYVPFGRYASNLLSAPVTQTLGRTLQRAITLGYAKHGLYAAAYAAHGDTYVHNDAAINLWGVNLGYKGVFNHVRMDVGAGFINNLADSQGMQNAGVGGLNDQLVRRVSGIDLHGEFNCGPWGLFSEYVFAGKRFDTADMTFNEVTAADKGAKPRALHVEGSYRLRGPLNSFVRHPVMVSAGYEQTWQALALNLPRRAVTVGLSTSLFKNTIQSIEYRYQRNYRSSYEAAVDGVVEPSIGSHSKTLTLQTGVYF